MIKRVLGCFLSLFYYFSFSQTPLLRELKLTDEGRSLEVTSTLIDNQGVIWLTAKTGLYISNGENVTKLASSENKGFDYTSIYQDRHGTIWVGNSKGHLFQFVNYTNVKFNPEEGMPSKPISQMIEDVQGNIWIATLGEGLYIYSNGKFYNLDQDDGLSDNYVYCIQPSGKQNIVCGTDIGFNYCEFKDKRKKVHQLVNSKSGLADEIVRDLNYVKKNLLAVGTEEMGVLFYDELKYQFITIGKPTFGTVNTICNINGELWAGFEKEGVVDFEFKPNVRVRNLNLETKYGIKRIQKIINSQFYSQIILAENRLFVTPGEWYESWQPPEGVGDKSPKAIAANIDMIFVAYPDGIFYKHFSEDWKKFKVSLEKFSLKAISCMTIDKNNHLWIGSLNDGLVCIDLKGKILKKLNNSNSPINNNVYCLAEYGNLMLYGSMNGIGGFNINTFANADNDLDIKKTEGKYVYDISIGEDSSILFGTDGYGIGILKDHVLNYILPGDNKEKKIILSIDRGEENGYWFSSLYYGLFQMKNGKVKNFPQLISVNNSPINALCIDENSNVLSVHDDFLSVYSPTTRQQFILQNDFGFSGLDVSNNMIVSVGGHVYIATKNGIVVFQPKRFRFMSNLPLIIQKKLLFLQPIGEEKKSITFKYNQNHISFECNFPWFFNPDKIKYEYTLQGFSKDTMFTSSSLISFPNLSPGKYKFSVRGKLQNAILNNGWTEISFEIKKPWYKTYWFIIFVLSGLFLTVYLILKLRINNFVKISEAKQFKLSQELRAMQSQVNPHFLFNSLSSLLGLIDLDTKKAKEYTEKLSNFYRDIVKYKDTDLIPLSYELEIVDTYIYLQNIRFDNSITVTKKIASEWIDKAKIAPLTIQILFENAIKHNKVGQGNQLEIVVETVKDGIQVTNNLNPKLYPESSTKTGLGFVKERCRILTGREAEVEITKEHFRVFIPLVNI